MTIQRVVQRGERVINVQNVVPGYSERLTPSRFGSIINYFTANTRPETHIEVVSDNEINYVRQNVSTVPSEYGTIKGKKIKTTLSKYEINDHSIESSRTLFGTKVIYEWVPSITTVSLEQEQAIQELIPKTGWSPDEIQQVRDRLIYAEQQLSRRGRHSSLRITSRRSNES